MQNTTLIQNELFIKNFLMRGCPIRESNTFMKKTRFCLVSLIRIITIHDSNKKGLIGVTYMLDTNQIQITNFRFWLCDHDSNHRSCWLKSHYSSHKKGWFESREKFSMVLGSWLKLFTLFTRLILFVCCLWLESNDNFLSFVC